MSARRLPDLARLHERHRGMTPATCAHHAEAAAIAFDAHHAPDIELTIVDRGHSEGYGHGWTPTTQRQRDAWASHNTTMEYGAYSVAVATIEATRNLRVVSRSADRSGADWRVGSADPVTEGELDLDSYPRLQKSAGPMTTPRKWPGGSRARSPRSGRLGVGPVWLWSWASPCAASWSATPDVRGTAPSG